MFIHDDQSMGHSDEQGDMLANDQAKWELRDAWIQMEETSPENNVDETAYEVLHEKPGVHVQDKLGINPRNGLKTLLRAEDRYNLVIKRGDDKTGEEVV